MSFADVEKMIDDSIVAAVKALGNEARQKKIIDWCREERLCGMDRGTFTHHASKLGLEKSKNNIYSLPKEENDDEKNNNNNTNNNINNDTNAKKNDTNEKKNDTNEKKNDTNEKKNDTNEKKNAFSSSSFDIDEMLDSALLAGVEALGKEAKQKKLIDWCRAEKNCGMDRGTFVVVAKRLGLEKSASGVYSKPKGQQKRGDKDDIDELADGPKKKKRAQRLSFSFVDNQIAKALSCSALGPIETENHEISDNGIKFIVRIITNLEKKKAATKKQLSSNRNPFAEENLEKDLLLDVLLPFHNVLLNKYPVLDRHLLLVTKKEKSQNEQLDEEDFQSICSFHSCIPENESWCHFYNKGDQSGRSQVSYLKVFFIIFSKPLVRLTNTFKAFPIL